MNSGGVLTVVIADKSTIVRNGLSAVVKRMPSRMVRPVEVASKDTLLNYMHSHEPEVVVVNPMLDGMFDVEAFKSDHPGVSVVALATGVLMPDVPSRYDAVVNLYDTPDAIFRTIEEIIDSDDDSDDDSNVLSQREKEIVVCVVKGLTNKAIADKLFISIHTVITHRRNIARKLQIHSPAGL
ncbi:MAG: response regulator transcription factor, partial [Muribaculaceae bacterium]